MHVASDSVLVASNEAFGIILNSSFTTGIRRFLGSFNSGTEKVEPQAAAPAQWRVPQPSTNPHLASSHHKHGQLV